MKAAQSIAFLLASDRLAYRSFGPYWWPIKALLRAKGYGEALHLRGRDADDPASRAWFSGMQFQDVVDEGIEYHRQQMQRGAKLDTEHTTPDGNEQYILHDLDMES